MDNKQKIITLINEKIKLNFQKIVISNPFNKSTKYFKVTIIPKKSNDLIFFQVTYFYETKVKHENYFNYLQISDKIEEILDIGYKQWDIILLNEQLKLIVNKKYNFKTTISTTETSNSIKNLINSHNNDKNYIIREGEPIAWLVSLGIMNTNGIVLKDKQKKFRQINRFLEMINDVYDYLPDEPTIIDFGCGKSYLTFALYYFLEKKNKKATIIGLDLKQDVVQYCNDLSKKFLFDRLSFQTGNIQYYDESKKADMVISLHACDTATDYAIHYGIKNKCKIIMSVPCCQHELFSQVENVQMMPLLKHGILKERFSALLTDSLRSSILEIFGYKCQVMEFIDMEHTPKNIMIRAVYKNKYIKNENLLKDFYTLKEMYSVEPTLYKLCKNLL